MVVERMSTEVEFSMSQWSRNVDLSQNLITNWTNYIVL